MLDILKSLPNLNLYFIFWGLSAYWLKRRQHKMFSSYMIMGIIAFIICSTSYIPKKLIASIEETYDPVALTTLDTTKVYYIHVLGAGATNDPRLPETMNLSNVMLARLAEGIRLCKYLDRSILVTSAASKKERRSQAELSMQAAIALGVNKDRIKMLDMPTTTKEEAIAFKNKFGAEQPIILTTSALHMPRAVKIFEDQGLTVIPAPTDYLYRKDGVHYNGFTLPSFKSLELMNAYQIAKLKDWYYAIFKKD